MFINEIVNVLDCPEQMLMHLDMKHLTYHHLTLLLLCRSQGNVKLSWLLLYELAVSGTYFNHVM